MRQCHRYFDEVWKPLSLLLALIPTLVLIACGSPGSAGTGSASAALGNSPTGPSGAISPGPKTYQQPVACQPQSPAAPQLITGGWNTEVKPGNFLVMNRYMGPWPAEPYTTVWVYAGANYYPGGGSAPRSDPPVPSIIVDLSTSCVPDYHESGVYALPTATSPLTIVSVAGPAVHLVTQDQTRYSFDLNTRTFSQP